MVSLCKGATPPSANGVPAKVVVCLTARSERMRGNEIRISQSKGVRETMRYADLQIHFPLDPSFKSIWE